MQIFSLDLTGPLPFEDNYADIVIMDLSLHYFSLSDIRSIVNEVFRVLKNTESTAGEQAKNSSPASNRHISRPGGSQREKL